VDAASKWTAKKVYNALGQEYPEQGAMTDKQARTILGVTLPTSQELRTEQNKAFGTPHAPHTQAGRYAAAISEQTPAALLAPGGPLAKGMVAVGSGAGGEFADQATVGTSFHPYARPVGQIVGSLPGAIVGAMTPSPQKVVGQALGDLSDQERSAAIALMQDAQQRGIQLTPAEAVQQVTNNGTGMGRMQRVIEGTKRGQDQLAPMFAQRPDQIRQAGMTFADQIAPPNTQPSLIGQQAQEAAQGGLDLTRRTINNAAEPHYQALRGQIIPDAQFAQLTADPSFRAALAELRGNPELNGPIVGLPDNDLSVVNEVVKHLDTAATAARQTAANPAGNNRLASLRGDARSAADALAANVSPDWRQARDIVAQGRQQYLDPLNAGPAGQIARTNSVPTQTGALYPANPLEGAPGETTQALQLMRAAEAEAAQRAGGAIATPGVGADLTRQHLVRALNEATASLQPGPNQWAGAKYAKAIAGNPEQAAALRAGVGTVAGPDTADELDTLLNVMRATGKRQPPGSMTAFNSEDLKGLGLALPETKSSIGNPLTWIRKGETALRGAQQRRNTDALVQFLLSNPDEADRFLAGASRYAPNRQSALGKALSAP